MLPAGFTIDYAGESRQLRTEGGGFLATFLLSAILIYLVLAAQFESFRDPFIILAGSVPLAVVRRAAVLVPRPDDAQHLQPGRADHAGRAGREERHPHRRVRESPAGDGEGQARRDHRGGRHAAAADPDDDGGDRGRPLPAGDRDRPGRRRAQQHRHHARERHDHRHAVHAVRRAVDLHAAWRGSARRSPSPRSPGTTSSLAGCRLKEHAA